MFFFCFFLGNSSPSGKPTTQNIQIRSPESEKKEAEQPIQDTQGPGEGQGTEAKGSSVVKESEEDREEQC